MCGISGIVGPTAEGSQTALRRMVRVQRHRGPDDEGELFGPGVALGHNRLAILDLSAAGHQPMLSPDNRQALVFNGEIYNYVELREELAASTIFRSNGDTEVLLAAYRKWGTACLDRLRGMFAFAIWDRDRDEVFLARDRFGIKPLHFAQVGRNFVFASEIKAILAAGMPPAADHDTVADFLSTGLLDHDERTFFAGVRSLEPGHMMVVRSDGTIKTKGRYYDLAAKVDRRSASLDFPAARSLFLDKFGETVRQHMRSDVPVGITISGGIDSSALLTLACRGNRGDQAMKGFSFDFADPRYSERRWVKDVIAENAVPTDFCLLDAAECVDALRRVTWYQEAPFGGIPTISMFNVYARARQEGFTVLLNGNGADDYMAGSRREVLTYLAGLHRHGPQAAFEAEAEGFVEAWGGTRDRLMADIRSVLDGKVSAMGADGTKPVDPSVLRPRSRRPAEPPTLPERGGSLLRRALLFRLAAGKLPRSLRFDDRNSMASSREVRVPFLDHELVELTFSLPDRYLVHRGWGKYILREALTGLIPETVRRAAKRDVQSPQREWLKEGPLADHLRERLAAPSSLLTEFLDIEAAQQSYRAYRNGNDSNSNFLWQWINLDIWYRTFIEDFDELTSFSPPEPRVESYSGQEPLVAQSRRLC